MRKVLVYLLIALGIVASASNSWCFEAEENWQSRKSAYDLHALNSSRFAIENVSLNGVLTKAAKFVVQQGDTFRDTTGERAEVVLGGWEKTSKFKVQGNDGLEFYRISVRLDEKWLCPDVNHLGYKWGSIFQLHGPDGDRFSASVALMAEDTFHLFLNGGDVEIPSGRRIGFLNGELNRGHWVDFILKTQWAIDSTGAISVFRRDEGDSLWREVLVLTGVPTLQYKGQELLKSHYWKVGYYRSESHHTNALWIGRIVRGASFEAVSE
jgi:hypothetical protein